MGPVASASLIKEEKKKEKEGGGIFGFFSRMCGSAKKQNEVE